MIRLSLGSAKGQPKVEQAAQVWPAHRDSPNKRSVQLEDGRAFILSEQAFNLLRQGRTLTVKIGESTFSVKKVI